MKSPTTLFLLLLALGAKSQWLNADGYSLAYYGEFVSHPGLKGSLHYSLKEWNSSKDSQRQRNISLSPSLGFFYHANYQSSFFVDAELAYQRSKKRHAWEWGLIGGYQRSFIPNSWRILHNGIVEQHYPSYGALRSGLFVKYQRRIYQNEEHQVNLYIKPSTLAAWTGYPSNTGYFFLEIGLNLKHKA